MNFTSATLAIRWLIRDTFRQSAASRISWVMTVVIGMVILLCLSAGFSGIPDPAQVPPGHPRERIRAKDAAKIKEHVEGGPVDVIGGDMTLLFGAIRMPVLRDRERSVRLVHLILAGWVADTAGVLLALVCTAGFLPAFLEPSCATVLLAKPVPRWSLLMGKFLGVLLFVLVQATVFVLGTWAALGFKTNVWDMNYLFALPLLMLHFSVFFSFSTFMAVWTRSTIACIFGTLLFWLMCWGMNFGHHHYLARKLEDPRQQVKPAELLVLASAPSAGVPFAAPWPGLSVVGQSSPGREPSATPASSLLMAVGYWAMPKPADMVNMIYDSLSAERFFGEMPEYTILKKHGALDFGLSVLTSLLFMVVMLGIAGYEFVKSEY
jgi:hypothetical protein